MKTKKVIYLLAACLISCFVIFQSGCSKDSEEKNSEPTCKIISPKNNDFITKDSIVIMSTDAEDNDGSVVEVWYYVDNIGIGSSTMFPYNYEWNTINVELGMHTIKATAKDNSDGFFSDQISIKIIEGPPHAFFSFQPQTGSTSTIFYFNASYSFDNATPADDLQVRWDWEGDGIWDTQYSTTKTANHQYSQTGTYNVNLEVKDSEEATDTSTVTLTVFVDPLPCPGTPTITYEGQTYNTVQIGTQCWLKENLNVGTMILGTMQQSNNGTIEKYCYNNELDSCTKYGGLYQWDEMMQYSTAPGVQGICPADWHLPSDAEWTLLTTFLGGEGIAGSKMKSTGTIEAGTGMWYAPNTGATNESDFTALPGGYRYFDGYISGLGYYAHFWSSTEGGPGSAWTYYLWYNHPDVFLSNYGKGTGYSIRCVKD